MRVSTAQFYFQNSQQLTSKQSDVNDQMQYISTGKRVLTAKDDAVSYGTLNGFKDELTNIEKYQRNITLAENRNSLLETSFDTATSILQDLKQRMIQANNGTLSDLDLKALADLTEDNLNQMLDIGNLKDETGGYVFSGYQIDVAPFALQPDNTVVYSGDNGAREVQIGKNVMVATSIPGDDAFLNVANEIGDFDPVYNTNTSGITVRYARIVDPSLNNTTPGAGFPPDYNFNFNPTAADLTVRDGDGDIIFATGAYVPGQPITLPNGVEVQIDGNPLPGDDIDLTPKANESIYETIKSAIDWMRVGASPADPVQHAVDYDHILGQVNTALNHMLSNQTTAGARLKLAETQESNHRDSQLYLETGRSNIEDLDFAKAIATFEQSKVALQAAQQTFVQVKNLSLFNYI